jgi:hypothetical protein
MHLANILSSLVVLRISPSDGWDYHHKSLEQTKIINRRRREGDEEEGKGGKGCVCLFLIARRFN